MSRLGAGERDARRDAHGAGERGDAPRDAHGAGEGAAALMTPDWAGAAGRAPRSRELTTSGTSPHISPLSEYTSLTMLELMKEYFGLVIKNIVST